MTVTKVYIIEEHKSIIICCGEKQPQGTKIVLKNNFVPRQMVYLPEHGFDPAPGARDQFSIIWHYGNASDWNLGDSFSIVNSNESFEVCNYGSGFEKEVLP